jgi:hypothetical protein
MTDAFETQKKRSDRHALPCNTILLRVAMNEPRLIFATFRSSCATMADQKGDAGGEEWIHAAWSLEGKTFTFFLPRVPGTEKWLKAPMSVTSLCMASWKQLDDDSLMELLDKAQAETERRRALNASQAGAPADPKPE